jgi:hypothetical protein
LHDKKRQIDTAFQDLHKKINNMAEANTESEDYVGTRMAIHNVHHEATSLLYSLTYDLLQAIDIVKTVKVAERKQDESEFDDASRGFCGAGWM